MKMLKLLGLFIVQLLMMQILVYAETIYMIDDQVINGKVTEKTKDTIWYEVTTGDITEETGIEISKVKKILNDDGSVSQYSPTYAVPITKQ